MIVVGVKEEVWMKTRCLNRLCEVVASPLTEYNIGMDIMPAWEIHPQTSVKEKACTALPQAS